MLKQIQLFYLIIILIFLKACFQYWIFMRTCISSLLVVEIASKLPVRISQNAKSHIELLFLVFSGAQVFKNIMPFLLLGSPAPELATFLHTNFLSISLHPLFPNLPPGNELTVQLLSHQQPTLAQGRLDELGGSSHSLSPWEKQGRWGPVVGVLKPQRNWTVWEHLGKSWKPRQLPFFWGGINGIVFFFY